VTVITPSIFLDLETTGTEPEKGDRIIEIALISPDEIDLATVLSLPNGYPNNRTPPEWFLNRQCADSPNFRQLVPEIERRIDQGLLIGHNITFDLKFIDAAFQKASRRMPPVEFIDTLRLAKKLVTNTASHQLESLCHHLDIQIDGPSHRAGPDARRAKVLFDELSGQLDSEEALPVQRYQRG
jgi:DNA polymerase III epsilon subunit-like protein